MENKKFGVIKSTQNNSILVNSEGKLIFELFADEKNIQPIIEALVSLIDTPFAVNIDIADIQTLAEKNNYADYIQIKGNIEDALPMELSETHAKGAIICITAAAAINLDDIDKFTNKIQASLDKDITLIWGVNFDNTLNKRDISASFIGLSNRSE